MSPKLFKSKFIFPLISLFLGHSKSVFHHSVTPNNKKCKHKNNFYYCLFLFFFTSHCFIFRSFDFTDRHSRSLILRPLGVGRQPPVRLGDYTNWDKNYDFCHSRVVSKSIEIGIGLNEVPSSDIKAGRMRWKRGISRSQLIFDWSSEDGPTLSGVIYSRVNFFK